MRMGGRGVSQPGKMGVFRRKFGFFAEKCKQISEERVKFTEISGKLNFLQF